MFLETHPEPDLAKCDGPCALPLKHLRDFLLQDSVRIDAVSKEFF